MAAPGLSFPRHRHFQHSSPAALALPITFPVQPTVGEPKRPPLPLLGDATQAGKGHPNFPDVLIHWRQVLGGVGEGASVALKECLNTQKCTQIISCLLNVAFCFSLSTKMGSKQNQRRPRPEKPGCCSGIPSFPLTSHLLGFCSFVCAWDAAPQQCNPHAASSSSSPTFLPLPHAPPSIQAPPFPF